MSSKKKVFDRLYASGQQRRLQRAATTETRCTFRPNRRNGNRHEKLYNDGKRLDNKRMELIKEKAQRELSKSSNSSPAMTRQKLDIIFDRMHGLHAKRLERLEERRRSIFVDSRTKNSSQKKSANCINKAFQRLYDYSATYRARKERRVRAKEKAIKSAQCTKYRSRSVHLPSKSSFTEQLPKNKLYMRLKKPDFITAPRLILSESQIEARFDGLYKDAIERKERAFNRILHQRISQRHEEEDHQKKNLHKVNSSNANIVFERLFHAKLKKTTISSCSKSLSDDDEPEISKKDDFLVRKGKASYNDSKLDFRTRMKNKRSIIKIKNFSKDVEENDVVKLSLNKAAKSMHELRCAIEKACVDSISFLD